MKNVLTIALKDIRQTLRDKMSFLFLLAMPVVFTLMFGFFLGGSNTGSQDARLPAGFLDLDHSAPSAALKGLLQASSVVRLDETTTDPAKIDGLVADGKLAAGVIVPAGYGAALQSARPVALQVIAEPASSGGRSAQAELQHAAGRIASSAQIADVAVKHTSAGFEDAFSTALAEWSTPPFSLASRSAAAAPKTAVSQNSVFSAAQTSPGMMVQFGMAGLITIAQMMVHERKNRCLQRLLTTPVARSQILLGHFLSTFATIFVQFVLLALFGQLALKVDYLRDPLATLVMMVSTVLFIACLGLLIGALAKKDEQAILFAMIPMFVFSGLGGAWMPLEATSQTFQVVGHLTPVAWAMDGFKNILVRGLDVSSVWAPAAALLGYAALFLVLGVWKFKFE